MKKLMPVILAVAASAMAADYNETLKALKFREIGPAVMGGPRGFVARRSPRRGRVRRRLPVCPLLRPEAERRERPVVGAAALDAGPEKIGVRDRFTEWTIRMVEQKSFGTYNALGPVSRLSMAEIRGASGHSTAAFSGEIRMP